MRKYLILALVAFGVGASAFSCEQAQTDATVVAEGICQGATQAQASGLVLNANGTAAINSLIAACAQTAGGTNLTQATAVAAIFASAVTLQQSGVLNNIKFKAMAPDELAALKRTRLLSDDQVNWIVKHAK